MLRQYDFYPKEFTACQKQETGKGASWQKYFMQKKQTKKNTEIFEKQKF